MGVFVRRSQGTPDPPSSSRKRALSLSLVARRIGVLSAAGTVIVAGVLSLGLAQAPAGAAPNNVSGTVTESAAAGGGAAENTNVSAQQQGSPNPPTNTSTDSSGNYGFDLSDGTWVITAQPPTGDTTDAATSTTVVISGGSITSGSPDITLAVPNVSGTVLQSNRRRRTGREHQRPGAAAELAQRHQHANRLERQLSPVARQRDLGHHRPAAHGRHHRRRHLHHRGDLGRGNHLGVARHHLGGAQRVRHGAPNPQPPAADRP